MAPGAPSVALSYEIAGHKVPLSSPPLSDFEEIDHDVSEEVKNVQDYVDLRDAGKGFDATVVVGETRIECHKELLKARVPFFRGLFDSNMKEKESGEVKIVDFDPIAVSTLIDYVYTGRVVITLENADDLMVTANYFGIESVMDECATFMRKRLRVTNALPLLMNCRSMGYDKIDNLVLRFFDKNFVSISATPEFLDLSAEDLEVFLHRDSLYVDKEMQVFDAITRWIGEGADRDKHAVKLLRTVRCTFIPETELTDVVEKTPWVAGSPECLDLLKESKEYYRTKEPVKSFTMVERRCDETHSLIFPIGLHSSEEIPKDSTMSFYDPITDKWTKCQNLPSTRGRNGVAVVDTKFYAIGGWDGKDRVKTCDVYDAETDKWGKMPDMSVNRATMATGVIDGKIYVAGGFDGQVSHKSMEMLNPSDAKPVWTPMASMEKDRGAPASCVFNGKLYVIGGHDTQQILKDGECYDPATNKWTTIADMKYRRCRFGAAVYNGQIYVVGGLAGAEFLRAVERYDPSNNTWTCVASITERRNRASVAVSCGKLYVLGGFDGLNNVNTVEMYQPEKDKWIYRSPMPDHKGGIFVGTLPIPALYPSPVANLEDDDVVSVVPTRTLLK